MAPVEQGSPPVVTQGDSPEIFVSSPKEFSTVPAAVKEATSAPWFSLDDFGFLDSFTPQHSSNKIQSLEPDSQNDAHSRESDIVDIYDAVEEEDGGSSAEKKGQRRIWSVDRPVTLKVDVQAADSTLDHSRKLTSIQAVPQDSEPLHEADGSRARRALLAAPSTPNTSQPPSPGSSMTETGPPSPATAEFHEANHGVMETEEELLREPTLAMLQHSGESHSDPGSSSPSSPAAEMPWHQADEEHERSLYDAVDHDQNVGYCQDGAADLAAGLPLYAHGMEFTPPSSPSPAVSPTPVLPPLPSRSPAPRSYHAGNGWDCNHTEAAEAGWPDSSLREEVLLDRRREPAGSSDDEGFAREGSAESAVMNGDVAEVELEGVKTKHEDWERSMWNNAADILVFEASLRGEDTGWSQSPEDSADKMANSGGGSLQENKVLSEDEQAFEYETFLNSLPPVKLQSVEDEPINSGLPPISTLQTFESSPGGKSIDKEHAQGTAPETFQWDLIGGSGPIKESVARLLWAGDRSGDLITSTWGDVWGEEKRNGMDAANEPEPGKKERAGEKQDVDWSGLSQVGRKPAPLPKRNPFGDTAWTDSTSRWRRPEERGDAESDVRESEGRARWLSRVSGSRLSMHRVARGGDRREGDGESSDGGGSSEGDQGSGGGDAKEQRTGEESGSGLDDGTPPDPEGKPAGKETYFAMVGGWPDTDSDANISLLPEPEPSESPVHVAWKKVNGTGAASNGQPEDSTADEVEIREDSPECDISLEAHAVPEAGSPPHLEGAGGSAVHQDSGFRDGDESQSAFEIQLSSEFGSIVDSSVEFAPRPVSDKGNQNRPVGGEQVVTPLPPGMLALPGSEPIARSDSITSSLYSFSISPSGTESQLGSHTFRPRKSLKDREATADDQEVDGADGPVTCSPFRSVGSARGGPGGKGFLSCFVGSPVEDGSAEEWTVANQRGPRAGSRSSWRILTGGKGKVSQRVSKAEPWAEDTAVEDATVSSTVQLNVDRQGSSSRAENSGELGSVGATATPAGNLSEAACHAQEQEEIERRPKGRRWFGKGLAKVGKKASVRSEPGEVTTEGGGAEVPASLSLQSERIEAGQVSASERSLRHNGVDVGSVRSEISEYAAEGTFSESGSLRWAGQDIQWAVLPARVAVLGKRLVAKRDLWLAADSTPSWGVQSANKMLSALSFLAEKPPSLGPSIIHFFPLHRIAVHVSGYKRQKSATSAKPRGALASRPGEAPPSPQGRLAAREASGPQVPGSTAANDNARNTSGTPVAANGEQNGQSAPHQNGAHQEIATEASTSGSGHGRFGEGGSRRLAELDDISASGNLAGEGVGVVQGAEGRRISEYDASSGGSVSEYDAISEDGSSRHMSPGQEGAMDEKALKQSQELRGLAQQIEAEVRWWLLRYIESTLDDGKGGRKSDGRRETLRLLSSKGGNAELAAKLELLDNLRKVQDWTLSCKRWGRRALDPGDIIALESIYAKIENYVQNKLK